MRGENNLIEIRGRVEAKPEIKRMVLLDQFRVCHLYIATMIQRHPPYYIKSCVYFPFAFFSATGRI